MSDPVLDEARLAAIQERAGRAKSPAITGSVYVQFLSGDIDWLLAHVGVLRADNQRLREQIERLEALYRRSNARMDELVAQGQWLEAQGAVLHGLWKSEDGVASDGD